MSRLSWSQALVAQQQANAAYALVTILAVKGSSPRAAGAKMVVTQDAHFDTIGGGTLEHEMIALARNLLEAQESYHEINDYVLGKDSGQCCGGKVTVLVEVFPAEPFVLAVFGAGHIAQRLMPLVDELPGKKYWIDQREEWINQINLSNTEKVIDQDPTAFVSQLPKQFCALVFTHNHALDFLLIEAMLRRDDAHYVGLIASKSKVTRFKTALRTEGFTEAQLAKLTAPVGLSSIPGKLPVEVAVSIAGQLIQQRHALMDQQHRQHQLSQASSKMKLVNQ